MGRWIWVLVGAAAATAMAAASAHADENFEPFPCEHDDSSSSSSSSDSSSSSSSDDSYDVGDAVMDVLFAAGSSASSSSGDEPPSYHDGGGAVVMEWPEELGMRLDAGYGALDLGPQWFVDGDNSAIAVLGSEIRIGSTGLAGAEFAFDFAPTPSFRLGAGVGVYGPIAGESGGSLGTYSRFGENAVVDGLTLVQGFVEAGFVQKIGGLNAFAVAHAGVMRAELEVSSDCGCNWRLGSTRFVFGPRMGLRTHLFQSLYLQAAVFADVIELPDYVATVGLGIGRRPR